MRLVCNCAHAAETEGLGQVARRSPSASGRNDVWAIGFVQDQLFDATKVRVLTVVGDFMCFVPAIDARYKWRSSNVADALEGVFGELGFPTAIWIDQGLEFLLMDLDLWGYRRGIMLDFSRPGKLIDNALTESFDCNLRTESLSAHWFVSLGEMRRTCE